MLSENRNDRPTAEADQQQRPFSDILNYRPTKNSISSFCGTCCKTSDEAMEDIEDDEQSLFVSDEMAYLYHRRRRPPQSNRPLLALELPHHEMWTCLMV
jgi:hypothetical protein